MNVLSLAIPSKTIQYKLFEERYGEKIRTDYSSALTFYKSLVMPHLDYFDVIYTTAKVDYLNQLHLAQNGAFRTLLLTKEDASVTVMHADIGLQTLRVRDIHLLNICHKNVHLRVLIGISNLFIRRNTWHVRISRRTNDQNLVTHDVGSQVDQKAIYFHGPNFWNNIPNDLKSMTKCNASCKILDKTMHK